MSFFPKLVGKQDDHPMPVGKRTWLDTAKKGAKGLLGLGAIASLPVINDVYKLHQFKRSLGAYR